MPIMTSTLDRNLFKTIRAVAIITCTLAAARVLTAQQLNWSGAQQVSPGEGIKGQLSREGLSAVVFKNQMYLVHAGQTAIDSYGNKNVFIQTSSDGVHFSNNVAIVSSVNGIAAASIGNPSITVYNNQLWVAFNNQLGGGVEGADFISSSDGVTWGLAGGVGGYNFLGSPSIVAFSNGLYLALTNAADSSIIFCRVQGTNPYCANFVNNKVSFNPSLGVFNGRIYIGYTNLSNDHQMWLLYGTDGNNFTTSNVLTTSTSSTPPEFAIHNNALYVGFRTNDGAHEFLYRYSSDGVDFSAQFEPGYTMGGYPGMVDATGLTSSSYNGALLNYFSSNDSSLSVYYSGAR